MNEFAIEISLANLVNQQSILYALFSRYVIRHLPDISRTLGKTGFISMTKNRTDNPSYHQEFAGYVQRRMDQNGIGPSRLETLSGVSEKTIRRTIKHETDATDTTIERLLVALDGRQDDGEADRSKFEAFREARQIERQQSRPALDRTAVTNHQNDAPQGGETSSTNETSAILTQQHTKQNSFRRQALLAGVGFSLIAVIFWNMNQDAKDATGEMAKQQTGPDVLEQENSPAPTATELELTPAFEGSWYRGNVRIWLRELRGVPQNAEIESSFDGSTFALTSNSPNFLPEDQFIVRLSSKEWSETLGPFDFTAQARKAAETAVNTAVQSNRGSDSLNCLPGACKMSVRSFCNGNWSRLTLGRDLNTEDFSLDLNKCDREAYGTTYCISAPQQLFPTGPSQVLYGGLYSQSGEKFDFQIEVHTNHGGDIHIAPNVVALEPVGEPGANPYASAWYEPISHIVRHHFRIELAGGGCNPGSALEKSFKAIFYDVDGQGPVQGSLRHFNVPEPSRNEIEISLLDHNDQLFGPYRYKFDVSSIMAKARANAPKPTTIECRRTLQNPHDSASWFYECSGPRHNESLFTWAHVESIAFGSSQSTLTDIVPIALSDRNIIDSYLAGGKPGPGTVFTYSPRKDQNELYFQFHYVDGTQSIIQRFPLTPPPR